MKYIITNGHGEYIRKTFEGKYVKIRNFALAERWDRQDKAKNILKNALPKTIKKQFYVREIEENDSISPRNKLETCCTKDQTDSESSYMGFCKDKNLSAVTRLVAEPIKEDWIESIDSFVGKMGEFVLDCRERKTDLIAALSQIDKELEDIAHYIEFNSLDACKGFKAYKLMHQKRNQRRIIKDELTILTQLGDCKLDSNDLEKVRFEIEKLGQRVYVPRALPQLFE